MQNAKEEFLRHTNGKEVLCASISYQDCWTQQRPMSDNILKVEYTKEQYDEFIDSLDFEYDAGFGGQELFGTIWYKDGTWSDRGEYDGSEWWQFHICPVIPKKLLF
jgi:hypothetical protein